MYDDCLFYMVIANLFRLLMSDLFEINDLKSIVNDQISDEINY